MKSCQSTRSYRFFSYWSLPSWHSFALRSSGICSVNYFNTIVYHSPPFKKKEGNTQKDVPIVWQMYVLVYSHDNSSNYQYSQDEQPSPPIEDPKFAKDFDEEKCTFPRSVLLHCAMIRLGTASYCQN